VNFWGERRNERDVSPIWFPRYEYRRMLGIIRKELSKQIIAPVKVLRLRCWLYYKVIEDISIRWIKLRSVIEEAVNEGEIAIYKNWLTLKEFDEEEIKRVYELKKRIEEKWGSVAGHVGHWFEGLVGDAFQDEGYVVSEKATFKWNGKNIEIDVYCLGPVQLAVEVKNKSSDVFCAPTIIAPFRRNEDHEQILDMFKFCKEKSIIPILMASFVDKSFQGFAAKYKGLYIQTLFQFFPEKYEELVNRIKEKDFNKGFYFGNVRAGDSIAEHVRERIKAIPRELKRLYDI